MMEDIFSKVRTQVNSTLDNQKRAATTLLSVEKTLKENNAQISPADYFTALFTLLQEPSTEEDYENKAALVYLLSIVFPHVSQEVLKSEYSRVLDFLVSTLEDNKESAPISRATIACLESLLTAQDNATWKKLPAKKTFQSLLLLCLDGRPKVRRRAQEAVHKIISCTPSPTFRHPAIFSIAKFCIKELEESTQAEHSSAIHLLALIKPIVSTWPTEELGALLDALFELPKLDNSYLTVAVFEVLQNLFKGSSSNFDQEKITQFLEILLEMRPNNGDIQLSISWLKSIACGYEAYARYNQEECASKLGMVFAIIFLDLGREQQPVVDAAAECLSNLIEKCVTVELIPEIEDKSKNPLKKIITLLESGLRVRYKTAWPGILNIYSTLFKKLGRASVPLLNRSVELIAELKDKHKEYEQEVNAALEAVVAAIGPRAFLNILPLNLEQHLCDTKQTERSWLLPILKGNIANSELRYFIKELLPLTENLKDASSKVTNKGKPAGHKNHNALVQGIWALLPGFCQLPYDLIAAFDQDFAELLGNIIYSEPELRPIVCTSLQLLIQKNFEFSSSEVSDEDLRKKYQMDKKDATANIQHLAGFSTNFLAIFFNIFSQTPPESRQYLTEIIQLFLKITTETDIHETFEKVHHLLADALNNHSPASEEVPSKLPPMAHTMMDLSAVMTPFLGFESLESLLETIAALIEQEEDAVLQKISYEIMNRMSQCENGKTVLTKNIEKLQTKLLNTTLVTSPLAKEERLKVLANVVQILPSSDLSFIPSILSETIVCTKEANECSRNLAYDLLVVMGNRMKEGGIIITSKIAEMDPDAQNAEASIAEYFTMVTAGLAGSTPSMISATITSLSRLLFEFRSSLSRSIVDDLMNTIHMFVISANREVVKSALGFVKVAVLTLDSDFLKPHLSDIVTGILTWSHEHKNHFKDKVRHIFERLIRKLSYDQIAQVVPEEHLELVANIKKRKDRARRGKNKAANSEDEDQGLVSESEDSDDDTNDKPKPRKKGRSVTDESENEGTKFNSRRKPFRDGKSNNKSFTPAGNSKKRRSDGEGEFVGEKHGGSGARDQNKRPRGRGGHHSEKGGQRFRKENRPKRGDDDKRGSHKPYAKNPRGKLNRRGSMSGKRRN